MSDPAEAGPPTLKVRVAYSKPRGAPAKKKNALRRQETAELESDIAALEAENAEMEKRLQVEQRPSFIGLPSKMAKQPEPQIK